MTLPLLPGAPARRCICCHHPIPTGRVYGAGYGETCARRLGLIPPAAPHPRNDGQEGPDLFDAAGVSAEFSPALHSEDDDGNRSECGRE